MPPPNTTPATAIDITVAPYVNTQDPGAAGVELWYKYTGQLGDVVVNIYNRIIPVWSPGHYLPSTAVYDSLIAPYLGGFNQADGAIQVPVAAGQTIYFQISNVIGTYTAGDTITISLTRANMNVPISGDFFINDDTNGFKGIIFNSTNVVRFVDVISGERGDVLPDGTIMLQDRSAAGFNPGGTGVFGDNLRIYDNQYNIVNNVPGVIANTDTQECIIFTDYIDKFYVIQNKTGNDAILYKISKLGVVESTWIIPSGIQDIKSAALSRDLTKVYLQYWDLNPAVKVFVLASSTFAADFAAGPGANKEACKDILVFPDDSVLYGFFEEGISPNTSSLVHRESIGTLRYQKNYSQDIQQINRIHQNSAYSSVNYHVWFYIPTNPLDLTKVASRISTLSTIDGSVVSSFDIQNYEIGLSTSTDFWDGKLFGPSTSCPLLVVVLSTPPSPPNPGSGIYKLVPGKHNDTLWNDDLTSNFDVKIP